MKRTITFLAILFTAFVTEAQTAEDSVKAIINRLFEGMKNADTSVMTGIFADSAIFQTIAVTKEGKTVIRNEYIKEFVDFVSRQKKGSADERIRVDIIKIDGPLAIVWTPYKFYFNGQFSHCGVNSFHLVRLEGNWKIQYLIDTRRRQGCE